MKKFLSLVLALVMTMSLVTISAGAKDFTDADKINYGQAIDVVSAVKIVDGYEDGSFNPQATLTRGAAAKIICNMILGPTTAGALVADAAPFKDVPVNHTFAGYIAYCAKEGIISGYADGTFKPAATLTGYAFMKMLLGALGYDAATEGYTGANWSINVAKRALQIGLDDDLVDDFNGVKAVTREEAALYAFNTLQADIVTYGQQTNITIGDAVINIGNKAESIPQAGSVYSDKLGDNKTVQFSEKYFSKLTKSESKNAFEEPSTTWRLSGKKIGDYADAPKLTYTKTVNMKTIYADLGLSEDADSTAYYQDGNTVGPVAVTKTGTAEVGGNGTVTTVFTTTNSSTGKVAVRIVEKQVFIAKVASIDPATATTKRTVNLVAKGSATSTAVVGAGADKFETEDFARGDYVWFTATTDDNTVRSMGKAEKVTGELTAYAGNSTVVVGGVTYPVNKVGFGGLDYDNNGGSLKDVVDVYLDANGNVLDIETSEAAAESYAVVLDTTGSGTTFAPYKAELLFLDGTTKIVETKDNYNVYKNQFVNFRTETTGKSILTDADNYYTYAGGAGALAITNGVSAFTYGTGNTLYANDSTLFVMKDNASGSVKYTTYVGHKNVPTITASDADMDVVISAGKVVKYVFIDLTNTTETITGGTSNVIIVLGNTKAGLNVDSNSDGFYTFAAVTNGTIGTINVDKDSTYVYQLKTLGGAVIATGKTESTTDVWMLTSNATGNITDGADVGGSLKGIGEVTKSTISFGWDGVDDFTDTRALANDCHAYVAKDGVITEIEPQDIGHDTNDWIYYSTKDGAVNNILIIKK